MKPITPCLWFDSNAEEAVRFYTSIFRNSKTGRIARYGEAGRETHGRAAGSVMTIEFEINGQPFVALNGGPGFRFTEAVSFQVFCETQEEIDSYWEKLGQGGDAKAQQCGWIKDRYGLSWQIVPAILPQLMRDPAKTEKVMQEVVKMTKLDIATMQKAAS